MGLLPRARYVGIEILFAATLHNFGKVVRVKGFYLVLLTVLCIAAAGCTSQQSGPDTSAPVETTVVTTVATTATTANPVPTPTEDVAGIRAALDAAWLEIQKADDDHRHRVERMGTAYYDVNYYRETIVPATVAMYGSVKRNLTAIGPASEAFISERDVLTAICAYKSLALEGDAKSEQGKMFIDMNEEKARTYLLEAKYTLQSALDTLNQIPDPTKDSAPLYMQKYADMWIDDRADLLAQKNLLDALIHDLA